MLTLSATTDYPSIPVCQSFRARLHIRLASQVKNTSERPPLNLAMVLDHSGSMAGHKLQYVKQAAALLISRLSADDIVSLTVFDHMVDVLIPPASINGLTDHGALIESIRDGGSTCLSGGYQKGYELAQQKKKEHQVSRILLLTDGLANVGITDHDKLVGLAREFRSAGVTTTTIGVGDDYDEQLLGAMAEAGGGGTYFIENPDDAPAVFTEELGYLFDLAASNLTLEISPKQKGITCTQLNTYPSHASGIYDLGDVYAGQERSLILELEIPAQPLAGTIDLADIRIAYRDVGAEGMPLETARMSVSLGIVTEEEFSRVTPDHDITVKATLLFIAATKRHMIELSKKGEFTQAAKVAEEAASRIESLRLTDGVIIDAVRDLRKRAEELRTRREEFFTANESKRMFYEASFVMKDRSIQLEKMMDRRKNPKGGK